MDATVKGAPTPVSPAPTCAADGGTWCQLVFDATGNRWLAEFGQVWIAKPAKIVLIVVLALILRFVVHRMIDKLVTPRADGKPPAILRPLAERAPNLINGTAAERRRQRAKTIGSVLKSLTTFAVLGIAAVEVLAELGINLGPILASAGIVGVALGFGAQNLVKDFLSGMFMMIEDQYGVGDVVDTGEASGTVEAVGLRITTLRDANGTVWYVRNGEILRVGNKSQGYAIALVDVPLAHGSDVTRASAVITQAAQEAVAGDLANLILEQPTLLGVESVTAEAMSLRITVKVSPGKQWAVERALRGKITSALAAAGFDSPISRAFGPPTPPRGELRH